MAPDPLGGCDGVLERGRGHDQRELLAAASDEDVHPPHHGAHPIGKEPEGHVAHRVTVVVVHLLEMIEIHEEHAHRHSAPPRALDLFVHPRLQIALVVSEGEIVRHRQASESGALDGWRRAVREKTRERLVVRRKRRELRRRDGQNADDLPRRPQRLGEERADREACADLFDEAFVLRHVVDEHAFRLIDHPADDPLAALEGHRRLIATRARACAGEELGVRAIEEADRRVITGKKLERRLRDRSERILELRARVRELPRELEEDDERLSILLRGSHRW